MIHTILEWKNGSERPVDDNKESATELESLYLPAVDESTIADSTAGLSAQPESEQDGEGNVEAEEEEGESSAEQDQGEPEEDASEGEHSAEEDDEDTRIGCVQVIENAEFDFDTAAEKEKAADGQNQPLLGLVLTPTRELAVQVKHHIDAVAKFTGELLIKSEL